MKLIIHKLEDIPGIGKSIAQDLRNIDIFEPTQLKGASPEDLYKRSNRHVGVVQDRCLLYTFRCAVYVMNTKTHEPRKLKWWNWMDEDVRKPR